MIWNFYPDKEFSSLSVRGSLDWEGDQLKAEFTVLGADPEYPLRAYAECDGAPVYLGLLAPDQDGMRLTVQRNCPPCKGVFLSIGRAEDTCRVVARGTAPAEPEPQIVIDDAPKQKSEEAKAPDFIGQLSWERHTKPEEEGEAESFLFSHPSVQANLKFYGHYGIAKQGDITYYAFASSFGPHPLPHLARYSCWYDIDLGFGFRGYFLIGLKEQEFFLPE